MVLLRGGPGWRARMGQESFFLLRKDPEPTEAEELYHAITSGASAEPTCCDAEPRSFRCEEGVFQQSGRPCGSIGFPFQTPLGPKTKRAKRGNRNRMRWRSPRRHEQVAPPPTVTGPGVFYSPEGSDRVWSLVVRCASKGLSHVVPAVVAFEGALRVLPEFTEFGRWCFFLFLSMLYIFT